jgi:hypothetical protein
MQGTVAMDPPLFPWDEPWLNRRRVLWYKRRFFSCLGRWAKRLCLADEDEEHAAVKAFEQGVVEGSD